MGKEICRFDILAHNDNGYLVYCNECANYQLAFGTVVMTLCLKQLQHFQYRLAAAYAEAQNDPFPHQKTIRMQIGAPHIRMALSPDEAGILLSIFDEAEATVAFRYLMEEIEWS